MAELAVLAIGGNSLIKDERRKTVEDQLQAIQETVEQVVELMAGGLEVVITHGNGPQVGFILRRAELAYEFGELHPVPLKNCVADTQGAIGYQLQETLYNALGRRGLSKQAVSLVTLVEVDPEDPSFDHPTKPIGSFYPPDKAQYLAARHPHWRFMHDPVRGFRRVVPSPRPRRIIELECIRLLVEQGVCVVAAGGGGIPVVRRPDGGLEGVDAVVDKDLTASLLARGLGAGLLVISTAVEQVYLNYGREDQKGIDRMDAAQARRYLEEGQFAAGSMLPKIQAALEFLDGGGREAIITCPEKLPQAVQGRAGTHIVA